MFGTEYLGTTQIVTLTTAHGTLRALARRASMRPAGERVGLEFRREKLSLFDKASGKARAHGAVRGWRHG